MGGASMADPFGWPHAISPIAASSGVPERWGLVDPASRYGPIFPGSCAWRCQVDCAQMAPVMRTFHPGDSKAEPTGIAPTDPPTVRVVKAAWMLWFGGRASPSALFVPVLLICGGPGPRGGLAVGLPGGVATTSPVRVKKRQATAITPGTMERTGRSSFPRGRRAPRLISVRGDGAPVT